MKYYLSSYRIGNRPDDFVRLAANRPLALIPNALDGFELEARQLSNARALEEVRALGIDIEVVDLQAWFGRNDLARVLKDFGGVWVRGGNTFVLRRAMHLSGLDRVLGELRGSDFLYSGYSAGACVLAPDLRGLQQVDDPHVAPYPDCPVIWEGLGFLDYLVLPHYKSDHPESAAIDLEVDYCTRNGIPFRTLRDGEVIIAEDEAGLA